ncbi:hypothetical protein ACSBR2_016264 [Camellia fascicularis]
MCHQNEEKKTLWIYFLSCVFLSNTLRTIKIRGNQGFKGEGEATFVHVIVLCFLINLLSDVIPLISDSHSQFLAIAVEAAKIAGDVIRKGFYQTKHVEHKGEVDLVTETEKACEDLIFNHLKKHFPQHKFIGEETTAARGVTELTDEPTWIIDPLDGTTNFVHGFPFVCVSIGLTIGKVPTVGVVYNRIMDELFTCVHRKGAFLNGNPIKVSSQSELVKSLLVTELLNFRKNLLSTSGINGMTFLCDLVKSLRMCGSCALDLCGVACGRIDLFYELGFGGPWDVAGGAVIVTEAGGCEVNQSVIIINGVLEIYLIGVQSDHFCNIDKPDGSMIVYSSVDSYQSELHLSLLNS